MLTLSLAAVPNWSKDPYKKWSPASVDTPCPFCARTVNFSLGSFSYDPPRNTVSASARCPACSKTARFWIVDPGDGNDTSQRGCQGLFIYPAPRATRVSVVPSGELGVKPVERAYLAAINAYNAGLWDACATSCRKTLEGIVQTQLPESKPPLFNQLQELFATGNLSQPLAHLTDSLRKAGNFGAHFNLEAETDQEVATLMLDLLDQFLEYLYVLKATAARLEERIAKLNQQNGTT